MTQVTSTGTRDWETWCYQEMAGLVRVSFLPWCIVAFVGLMAFDAPGSERDIAVWAVVIPVWIYPLTAGLGGLLATRFKRQGHLRKATLALGAPALLTMAFIGMVIGCVSLFTTGTTDQQRFQDVASALQ